MEKQISDLHRLTLACFPLGHGPVQSCTGNRTSGSLIKHPPLHPPRPGTCSCPDNHDSGWHFLCPALAQQRRRGSHAREGLCLEESASVTLQGPPIPTHLHHFCLCRMGRLHRTPPPPAPAKPPVLGPQADTGFAAGLLSPLRLGGKGGLPKGHLLILPLLNLLSSVFFLSWPIPQHPHEGCLVYRIRPTPKPYTWGLSGLGHQGAHPL